MPDVTFDWTGQRNDTNDRKIQRGECVEMTNVRRRQDGNTLEKRTGYDRASVSTFIGGLGFQGGAVAIECSDVKIVRDSADQLWLLNSSDSVGYYRGKHPRASHTLHGIDAGANMTRNPVTDQPTASELWRFFIDDAVANKVRVTVTDPATGAVKVKTTSHTLLENTHSCAGVVDGSGNVWFFHTNGGGTIYSCKFTAADVAPTITLYISTAGGRIYTTIDLKFLTAGTQAGKIVVYSDHFLYSVGAGLNHTFGHYVSTLNTATGGPDAGAVTTATAYVDSRNAVTEGGTMFGDGTGNIIYVSAYKPNTAAVNSLLLLLYTISTATLAVTATVTLATIAQTSASAYEPVIGVAAGYIAANGDRVVFGSYHEGDDVNISGLDNIPDSKLWPSAVNRYTYNGVSTAVKLMVRSGWLASRVLQVGSAYYFLSGFDDGPSNRVQRGYFLHNSDGVIMDDILNGSGTSIWHGAGFQTSYPYDLIGYTIKHRATHVVSLTVINGRAWTTILQEGTAQRTTTPTVVEINFSPVCHSRAPGVAGGGVPITFSARDVLRELAPIHGPHRNITFTNGGGILIGTYRFAVVFAVISAGGDITRSAPRIFNLTVNSNASDFTMTVPCYHHAMGASWIEIYCSAVGTADLRLHSILANDPTADSVTFKFAALSSPAPTGELLYTTGGALENSPVPSSRIAVEHKGRLFLFGTEDNLIWFSQEKRAGRGYEFNETLVIDWPQRKGAEWWAAPLSPDVLAFGDGVSIGLISGVGPDGSGVGAFEVTTLNTKKVPNNPLAVASGPQGVYFQKRDDGRLCLLAGAAVTEISQGAEAFRAFTFVAAAHVEGRNDAKGEVAFVANNGKIAVLDCDRPIAGQPAGTWILHENHQAGLPNWLGAQVIGGALVALELGTTTIARTWQQGTGFADNGVDYLKSWKTGRYALAGFLGEFDVDRFLISSTQLAAGSQYRYTVYNDQGVAEQHADAASTTPDVGFRSAHNRTRDFALKVEETVSGGQGRSFDGVSVEFKPYGRIQNPYRSVA